jgi:hypothetical protein
MYDLLIGSSAPERTLDYGLIFKVIQFQKTEIGLFF